MAEVTSFKFNLGDTVCSKKTGYPGVGRIIGLMQATVIGNLLPCANTTVWDELYPNWRDGILYYVLFDTPRKIVTLEELKKAMPDQGEFQLRELLETLPQLMYACYCEDDLEIFE
jgi:hypothetical protein